jgi:hypothetical protein
MDEEPTTDFAKANGKITLDPGEMAKSWDVTDVNVEPCLDSITRPRQSAKSSDTQNVLQCNKFFTSKVSSLQSCFDSVS